eukprot:296115-Rhodomonas_salina.1
MFGEVRRPIPRVTAEEAASEKQIPWVCVAEQVQLEGEGAKSCVEDDTRARGRHAFWQSCSPRNPKP